MSDHPQLTHPSMAAVEAIFQRVDPPLWLVTARAGGRAGGLIATSVMRVSIVTALPRVLIALAKHHHTWGLIQSSGRFALHLLPSDHLEAVWRFGIPSGHRIDKFAGLQWHETPDGNPCYPDAASWMDCRVEQRMDLGDRTAYLARITVGELARTSRILTLETLLREAPPDRKAELARLLARDQDIDAAAILAWRQEPPSD